MNAWTFYKKIKGLDLAKFDSEGFLLKVAQFAALIIPPRLKALEMET